MTLTDRVVAKIKSLTGQETQPTSYSAKGKTKSSHSCKKSCCKGKNSCKGKK